MISSLLLLTTTVVGWATLDALRKHLAARVPAVPMAIALGLGVLPVFLAWAAWADSAWPAAAYWPWAIAAAVGNIGGAVLLLVALRRAPLSIVIPLLSLTPVLSAGMAAVLLGEWPAARQWAGMGLVILGAGVLSVSGQGRANLTGVAMGVGVAACFAATVVLDKGSLNYASVPVHGVVTGVLMAGGLLAGLALTRRLGTLQALRAEGPMVALAALVLAVALGSQLMAVQLWLVSVVEGVKRAVGLSAAVLVGRVAFHEPITAGKILAVVLMMGGIALLI